MSKDTTATDLSKPADNTGRNVRDREGASVTPSDQPATGPDMEVTQRVRQSVTKNDQLSIAAKNVKIITVDGRVTLRGPVNSDAEKQKIEQLAHSVEGVKSIDNQLEVKSNP